MLQEVFEFLLQNPDALKHVKEGTASLLSVSAEEAKAIIDTLTVGTIGITSYWN